MAEGINWPKGYATYNEWLSDDNWAGGAWYGPSTTTKKKKKKSNDKPKDKPAPAPPPAAPTPSVVDRFPDYGAWNPPAAAPAPMPAAAPPAPVINFEFPETPYQPTVMNRQTAVNNRSLKIDSSYKKPKNRGGTTGFRRSKSPREFGTNAAMRINKSLSV